MTVTTGSQVVLDIGADVGALVLYAPPDLAGTEIEVSRAANTSASNPRRTHAVVRERRAAVFAAVYPDLPAGAYTIWQGDTAMGTVQVSGGEVATWHWPAG